MISKIESRIVALGIYKSFFIISSFSELGEETEILLVEVLTVNLFNYFLSSVILDHMG